MGTSVADYDRRVKYLLRQRDLEHGRARKPKTGKQKKRAAELLRSMDAKRRSEHMGRLMELARSLGVPVTPATKWRKCLYGIAHPVGYHSAFCDDDGHWDGEVCLSCAPPVTPQRM